VHTILHRGYEDMSVKRQRITWQLHLNCENHERPLLLVLDMVLLILLLNDLSARWIPFTLPVTVALGNGPDYACIYHQGRHRVSELGNEPLPELINLSTMQTHKWGPPFISR
jgi:hypothetical protein